MSKKTKEKLYTELIASLVRMGKINPPEYKVLLEKGKELGFGKETVDLLITFEVEQAFGEESFAHENNKAENVKTYSNQDTKNLDYSDNKSTFNIEEAGTSKSRSGIDDAVHEFRSAITRLGPVLTPHIIKIYKDKVEYRKRNKHLINVDSLVIPINRIASVLVDTSIWGTDVIIKSYGAGKIVGKNFSKSDAKKIHRLIQERQNI